MSPRCYLRDEFPSFATENFSHDRKFCTLLDRFARISRRCVFRSCDRRDAFPCDTCHPHAYFRDRMNASFRSSTFSTVLIRILRHNLTFRSNDVKYMTSLPRFLYGVRNLCNVFNTTAAFRYHSIVDYYRLLSKSCDVPRPHASFKIRFIRVACSKVLLLAPTHSNNL